MGLKIKDTEDASYSKILQLSKIIDHFLGLKVDNDIYLSENGIATFNGESKSFDKFIKLEIIGKGYYYLSVYKVYHRPTRKQKNPWLYH